MRKKIFKYPPIQQLKYDEMIKEDNLKKERKRKERIELLRKCHKERQKKKPAGAG